MADKRGFFRRNRGLSNSNTRTSHTNKKYILKQPDTDELCRSEKNRRQSSTLLQHVSS